MRDLAFVFIILVCLSSCSSKPKDDSSNEHIKTSKTSASTAKQNLEKTVLDYKNCTLAKDVECIFSLTDRYFTQRNGLDLEKTKELYSDVTVSKFDTISLSEPVKQGNKLISDGKFNVDFSFLDQEFNKIEHYHIISQDDGKTWQLVPLKK